MLELPVRGYAEVGRIVRARSEAPGGFAPRLLYQFAMCAKSARCRPSAPISSLPSPAGALLEELYARGAADDGRSTGVGLDAGAALLGRGFDASGPVEGCEMGASTTLDCAGMLLSASRPYLASTK